MAYRILIVDDDIELLKMLKNYFEIKRYDVMMAEDGTDALEKIHKKPDIILLDINMPKIDGLEVCRRIRGKVTCPIIFLTAKVEEQDRVNGLLLVNTSTPQQILIKVLLYFFFHSFLHN